MSNALVRKDLPDGRERISPKLRHALDLMIWGDQTGRPLPYDEAARRVNIKTRSMRQSLERPVTRAHDAAADRAAKAETALVEAAAAHEQRLAELSAAQVSQHQKRKDEIARGKAALETERRELDAERQRISDRERWVEHRAADLTNRLRGAA